jgi:hypothetical protein
LSQLAASDGRIVAYFDQSTAAADAQTAHFSTQQL